MIPGINMDKHSKFTVKELSALPNAEKGKRPIYSDTGVSGLGIRVTATGVKSFIVRKYMGNKAILTTLGHYPAMTIAQARSAAREALNEISAGNNPNTQKAINRIKTITLHEAMNDYISSKHSLKHKTIRDYQILLNKYLSDWEGKELVSITKSMISKKHTAIGSTSIYRANATMRLLRAIFNFAMNEYEDSSNHPIITYNPVQKIKDSWFKEKVRTNIIQPNDLGDWFTSVNNLPNNKVNINHKASSETIRDYLLLLLFTGLRASEGRNLTWDDIDLKNKLLRVYDTKNGEDHTLPLTDYLVELLTARKEGSLGDYVFPGYDPQKALVNANKQVKRVIDDSGVQFILHDLRRTFASYAGNLSIQHSTIKRLLNHKEKDVTTKHYIQYSIETLRDPMQEITDYILERS